ncbi:MAG: class I SAM-dependent methyltransferase, partial [Proteobacteria bacterium]|nr:class I SAM-dependent methyltransferase [Pseudomonadota bacterium]
FKLRKQGWQVTGQEIDPPAIAQARKLGIDVHDADLSTYAGPGNFDAIILVHVIEHLLHPLNVLQEARKLLAPGGQLILITPNPQSFGKTLFRKYWIPLAQPFHVRLYDPLCLSRLAAKAGFTPIRCFTNSTHSGPNIRASIKATLDANPHSIGFKLLKLVGLAYFIEIAVLLFLLLSDACSLGKGDECVLVCH